MEPTGLLVVLCLLHASGAALLFDPSTTSVTVPEDKTNIYTLKVTGGAVTSYEVKEGTSATASALFEAGTDNVVKLIDDKSLDFEKTPRHTLKITATGGGAPTATMTLTVVVTNVAPSFDKAHSDGVNIANGTKTGGTAAGTFKATDPGDSPVDSAIVCGNTNTDFAMDKTTGVVTVAPEKTIVVERTRCYTLVLQAVDNATSPLTGSTTVVITVNGGSGSDTCTADSNPCHRSGATFMAVSPTTACFTALLSLIVSTILG